MDNKHGHRIALAEFQASEVMRLRQEEDLTLKQALKRVRKELLYKVRQGDHGGDE